MGAIQMVVGSIISIIAYSLIIFAVYKIFQIANDLSEMKDILRDIKRNTHDVVAPATIDSQSPESLVRAVTAESYREP